MDVETHGLANFDIRHSAVSHPTVNRSNGVAVTIRDLFFGRELPPFVFSHVGSYFIIDVLINWLLAMAFALAIAADPALHARATKVSNAVVLNGGKFPGLVDPLRTNSKCAIASYTLDAAPARLFINCMAGLNLQIGNIGRLQSATSNSICFWPPKPNWTKSTRSTDLCRKF